MPFVSRNAAGTIVAVSGSPKDGCNEELSSEDPELVRFLATLRPGELELQESDRGFIRVLEDLIDLLVEKGTIVLDELPEDARDKILRRKLLRSRMRGHSGAT